VRGLTGLCYLFIRKHQEGVAIPQNIASSLDRPPKTLALRLEGNHAEKPAEQTSPWTPQESPVQKAMHLSIESGYQKKRIEKAGGMADDE
jgi:hypothetical protein